MKVDNNKLFSNIESNRVSAIEHYTIDNSGITLETVYILNDAKSKKKERSLLTRLEITAIYSDNNKTMVNFELEMKVDKALNFRISQRARWPMPINILSTRSISGRWRWLKRRSGYREPFLLKKILRINCSIL